MRLEESCSPELVAPYGSADEDAEQVGPAHSAVAAVGEISAHFVGARDFVIDLRQGGVDLQGGRHDLLGNVLMEPKNLPSVRRRGTGGKLLQLPDLCGDLDQLGGAFRGRKGCSGFDSLCPGGKGNGSQNQ